MTTAAAETVWYARERLSRISNLALPMIAGATATNVMGLIDAAMVGQLGDAALAGVGISAQLFFLFFGVLLGLAAGVQAMVARRVGEDRMTETGRVLNAGLLIACAVGALVIGLGYWVLLPVLSLISSDPELIAAGWAYLSWRLPSLVILGLNIAFRSYWVGVSLAKWSMVSILSLSAANIVFNYALIFGNFGMPQMGVAGAGLGSTLALAVGLLVNVVFAVRLALPNGFLRGLPAQPDVRTMLRVSYPESLRQILFSLGVMCSYVLLGWISTQALAAFYVITAICLIAYMPHIGIGGAATPLVGEAMGRDDPEDARRWGWHVANIGMAVLLLLALPLMLLPQSVLGFFFTDPATVALAALPLVLGLGGHVFDGYNKMIGAALIGAGDTTSPMVAGFLLQWLVFLPVLAWGVLSGWGLTTAMWWFFAYTALSAVVLAAVWSRGRWRQIVV